MKGREESMRGREGRGAREGAREGRQGRGARGWVNGREAREGRQ